MNPILDSLEHTYFFFSIRELFTKKDTASLTQLLKFISFVRDGGGGGGLLYQVQYAQARDTLIVLIVLILIVLIVLMLIVLLVLIVLAVLLVLLVLIVHAVHMNGVETPSPVVPCAREIRYRK